MKKYILAIAALTFIPSVAFASWWNPFTWFNSSSSSYNTDASTTVVLEKRIAELENKVNSLTGTTTSTTTDKTPVVKKVIATTPLPETVLPTSTSKFIPSSTSLVQETKEDLISKFSTLKSNIDNIISTNGLDIGSDPNAGTLSNIADRAGSNAFSLNESTNPSQNEINAEATQYNNLQSSFNSLPLEYRTANYAVASTTNPSVSDEKSSLKAVNIKLAELSGLNNEIIGAHDITSVRTVIQDITSATDIYGDKIFTPNMIQSYSSNPSGEQSDLLFVLQKQITQLNVLYTQYSY